MSYTRPPFDAAHATWQGAQAYTRPDFDAADAAWEEGTQTVVAGVFSATLPPAAIALELTAAGDQNLDIPDADGARIRATHAEAERATAALGVAQQQMRTTRTALGVAQQQMRTTRTALAVAQQQALASRRALATRHAHALPITGRLSTVHADALRTRNPAAARHQHGIAVGQGARLAHAEYIRIRRSIAPTAQHGLARRTGARIGHRHGLKTAVRMRAPHQQMIPLPVGWWQATYPWPQPPGPPGPPEYSSPVILRFCRLADGTTRLVFGPCPGAATHIIIPIREVYYVSNAITLERADNAAPIEVEAFSASLDVDSWCWGWSARMHADYMPLVRPTAPCEHVEVLAAINGETLRLVVERIGRDRRFGESWLMVSGRGRAAWLADPHSLVQTTYNATELTAQQLLIEALKLNGVSIGWDLDWRLTDWTVPAGAWSHTGTYIDAALRIAEAGGAYVQAHDTDQTLILLPRYPVAPWGWSAETPDIEMPEDVVEVEGIEWIDRPDYNAVWISGAISGRRDRIKRAGSAADRYAQSIVDPLATAPEMTRQRGLAVLGDTGRQAHITLRLPVLEEGGIIRPGQLVRYTEQGTPHIGLTRAVSLDASLPEIWQTVRLETHE